MKKKKPIKKKINSKEKGNKYEQATAKYFRDLGWEECRTSREQSKWLDDQKVDLTNTDPWVVQCKAWERGVYPHDILAEMPNDMGINVLFHKRNYKGEVVSLAKEDFHKILRLIRHIRATNETIYDIYFGK